MKTNARRHRTLEDARRGLMRHGKLVSEHRRKIDAEAWRRFGEWSDPEKNTRMQVANEPSGDRQKRSK